MPVPAAAFWLVAAAAGATVLPSLSPSVNVVQWIATVALVVILFDGGVSIGWRRFRASALPIASLGVPGTFATAGLLACFCHWALGLAWLTAGLVGGAVAPTDPAVMFSVFGDREVTGRTGTILEGESGANDPVGIALMLGLIELATHAGESFWVVVRVFTEQMAIGLAFGIAGGWLMQRTARSVVLAGVVFTLAYLCHGSGFLAAFVAGILAGDADSHRLDALRDRVASLAEVVVFLALGLTIDLGQLSLARWGEGLAVAAVVALAARPVVVLALLAPTDLRLGERLFVGWGGLKGAVPILLAAFALVHHVHDATRIYETVFVVVLASVVAQGGTIAPAARRFGVELRPRGERSA